MAVFYHNGRAFILIKHVHVYTRGSSKHAEMRYSAGAPTVAQKLSETSFSRFSAASVAEVFCFSALGKGSLFGLFSL